MPKGHEKESFKTSQSSSIDSLRDNKDVSNVLGILDSHVIKTNPFGANVAGDNSYKRAERISAALHLMTNHVPDTEPLRTTIRQRGLELLNLILELRAGFRAPASEKGQAALAEIRVLVSHVRLLAVAGYISAQNSSVIAEALDELGSLLTASQRSSLSEQVSISRDDLTPAIYESPRPDRSVNKPVKRTIESFVKDTSTSIPHDESTARTGQIMDILRLGGTLGIKDISANLPQYSEKMIQRELALLVTSGRVQKAGEKRWSRYKVMQ